MSIASKGNHIPGPNRHDDRRDGALFGGDEMGALIRAKNWSETPIGPIESWPQSLKTAVGLILNSRYAMFVWWGQTLTNLYNDAYRPFLGGKHPTALGQSAREVWTEIWNLIGPRTKAVLDRGESTFDESLLLIMERYGYPEETYFTFSYSPIHDDHGRAGGIFCAVMETTLSVIGERRLKLLRDVAAKMPEAHTAEQVCTASAACIAGNAHDLPFALLYLVEGEGSRARLVARTGISPDNPAAPPLVDMRSPDATWPFAEAQATGVPLIVEDLSSRFKRLPKGAWDRPPVRAVVAPLSEQGQTSVAGFLVAGLNPYLLYEEGYRGFIKLLAGQIASGIANARAYEEERRRAEALAEIDRAKTLFFSNVSHEFRTPLTLMLGPLEDALASPELPAGEYERLNMVHRNSLRLLKLVNSLLDFSRIEAERAQVSYEPTDLAALTAELASNFRSACKRAGLGLVIDCPPLPEPVYVDREMWEKILLNLLSNAFKFTFEGKIAVRLQSVDGQAELTVSDTGVGIPKDELPRLFERFHRIEGQRSRTYEGSGIGLALVQELVKLHGGAIKAESEANRGTRFTVRLPFGTEHLPHERIGAERSLASTSVHADAYLQEALRWLPDVAPIVDTRHEIEASVSQLRERTHILVADDNADMRSYVRRLLGSNYEIETVADGEAALKAIRERRPNLVLADVMMPCLDGFGLLRAIRDDPGLCDLPVIMLSARAGEESRVEGLEASADDYLVKPFSARELIARVSASLEIFRIRHETAEARRLSDAWTAGQKEAFQAAMDGAPLETSLGILLRTAIEQANDDRRCAFYIANAEGTGLYHVVGMSDAYAECVKGFEIGPSSLSCGLAVHLGQPVITPDVTEEPRWQPWLWMAEAHGYRGCWSFPVETSAGKMVGSFAMYFKEPRDATPRDRELAAAFAHAASIIISRYQESEQRARAEEDLKKSHAELRLTKENLTAALAASDTGTFRWNPHTGEFLAFDENLRRLFGFAPDEPVRITDDVIRKVHPDDLPSLVFAVDACRQGADFEMEYRVILPDGSIRWLYDRAKMMCDAYGNPTDLVGACTDITERKHIEQITNRLAAIVESSEDAIISKSLDGIIQTWNAGAERIFGYTAEEAIGRPVTILMPPDQVDEEPGILARIRGGERIEHYETVRQRKDGSLLDVSLSISPIRDSGGKVIAASKIARDITERVRAEMHRQLLIDELNHRVKNTLSTVQSFAMQTLRNAPSLAAGRAAFDARLIALSKAHDVLVREHWAGAGLREVVAAALAAYSDGEREPRITFAGPDIRLRPKAALALSMALHELATNAVKYGALSNESGRVEVNWRVAPDNQNYSFQLRWIETDGPPVVPPCKRGFGSRLIEQGLSQDLAGEVDLQFECQGVVCTIRTSLEEICGGGSDSRAR